MSITVARNTPDASLRSSPVPFGNDASSRTGDAPLPRARIGGRFSLVDHGPLTIAAERNLIVRVHTGSVWATQPGDAQYWLVRAGECFIAERTGLLVVRAIERGELEVDWPQLGTERLSPGLEPIRITH